MPPKGRSVMLAQLKLPTYTGLNRPPTFAAWAREVGKLNAMKRESLTEHIPRSAWTQTISDLDLANRETETNDKAGREAIGDIVQEVERSRAWEGGGVAAPRNVVPQATIDLDVTGYKLPWLVGKHIEAIRYPEFAKRIRQAKPDKRISQEIVEACFWKAVNNQFKSEKVKGPTATSMIVDGRKVLAQARKYWSDTTDDEMPSEN